MLNHTLDAEPPRRSLTTGCLLAVALALGAPAQAAQSDAAYATPEPLEPGSQASVDDLPRDAAVRVAFMPIAPSFTYYAAIARGAAQVATERGVDVLVEGPPGSGDNDVHVRMMAAMIERDIDALIIAVRDADLAAQVVRQAVEAGIATVVVNSDLRHFPTPVHAVVGYSQSGANRAMGRYAATLAGDTVRHVGILEGAPGYHSTEAVSGFEAGIADSGLTIVARDSGGWSVAGGETAAHQMLEDNPEIDLIWAANDNMIVGAANAARALDRGDVLLLGRDGDPHALDLIAAGAVAATTDTDPYGMGQVAMQVALDALNGTFTGGFVETATRIVDGGNVQDVISEQPTVDDPE